MSRGEFAGRRIAIFGLGRSGVAIGKAAKAIGAMPTVFDQKTLENLPKPELALEAEHDGVCLEFGWGGEFDSRQTDLIVTNPAVRRDNPALLNAVSAGIEVISEVEFAFRISEAPIVAVTGTNGKSTTAVMTYLCLQACGIEAVLCGNIFGSGYKEVPLTEAALTATNEQVLVAEVSSFQLEWVSKFQPISAGITNITPDHLDRHKSFREYADTKERIFRAMDERDYAVVRANDPVVIPPGQSGARYQPRHMRSVQRPEKTTEGFPRVLTFGATGEHARVEENDLVILGKHIRIDDLPFREPHNLQNACMAALLAYGALKNLAESGRNERAKQLIETAPRDTLPIQIIDGLKNFHGLEHRMELVGTKNGVRVINNSMCTNPDAVVKSTQAIRDPAHILIGGVNKGLDFGPLRHYLANRRNKPYLFGSDAENLNEMLGGGYPVFSTLEEAFHAATEAAAPGQVVVLSPGCASTDQFKDFRERGDVFKAMAKEWLES